MPYKDGRIVLFIAIIKLPFKILKYIFCFIKKRL